MFKWLKDWLNPAPYNVTIPPMPECKPPRKDGESPSDYKKRVGIDKNDIVLDISEPVFSFVNTVKANPRRFIAFEEENITYADYDEKVEVTFKIIDELTLDSFEIKKIKIYSLIGAWIFSDPEPSDNCKFLTKEECNYLITEISKVYDARSDRLTSIKNQRQRKVLIKIYGEVK